MPTIDEETKTQNSVEVIAPASVPGDVNLTLEIKKDSDTRYFPYASHVASDERVIVSGLESCTWYAVRWIAVSLG